MESTSIIQDSSANKVQIFVSCRKLKDLDIVSKSDPQCVVSIKEPQQKNYTIVGKSEVIHNNLNPDFTKSFTINYYFEKEQLIKFQLYDIDPVKKDDLIGEYETTIAKIMSSEATTVTADLKLQEGIKTNKNPFRGKIIVRADAVAASNDELDLQCSAQITRRGGFCCGLDNPYLLIQRARHSDLSKLTEKDFSNVHKTPSQLGEINPKWPKQTLKMQVIANSKMDLPLKFSLIHYREYQSHVPYGSFIATLQEIIDNEDKDHELKDSRGRKVGIFTFEYLKITQKPSFVDYLRSGWFINLTTAIDFTASNGEPYEPTSLHRMDENGQLNQYELAIDAVGKILEPYAYNNEFAAFGFGGIPRFMGQTQVNHCFNLSGEKSPYIKGLSNLFNLYRQALRGTTLNGPTYFAPILQYQLDFMKKHQDQKMYHILLFLTDGSIHDMRETRDLVVECAKYPLSVIIIGIGDADFSNMVELDGDDEVLRNTKGVAAERDIVQFVDFNEFKIGELNLLAEEVLKEVPDQVVSFMLSRGIQPDVQGQSDKNANTNRNDKAGGNKAFEMMESPKEALLKGKSKNFIAVDEENGPTRDNRT